MKLFQKQIRYFSDQEQRTVQTHIVITEFCTKQRPSSDGNCHPTGSEIPHILWNLNVHYCAHKRQQCVCLILP